MKAAVLGSLVIVLAAACHKPYRSVAERRFTTSVVIDSARFLPANGKAKSGNTLMQVAARLGDDIAHQRVKPPTGATDTDKRMRILYYATMLQYAIAKDLRDIVRVPISDAAPVLVSVTDDGVVTDKGQPLLLGAGERGHHSHDRIRVAENVVVSKRAWIDVPVELSLDDRDLGAAAVRFIDPSRFKLEIAVLPIGRNALDGVPAAFDADPEVVQRSVTYKYAVVARGMLNESVRDQEAYQRWLRELLATIEQRWAEPAR